MSEWLEVVVPTTVAAADEVAAELMESIGGAETGTQLRGDEIVFWVPIERGETALEETRELARSLVSRGLSIDVAQIRSQPAVPEAEWRDAWKRYFHSIRLTRQVVVVPSWEDYQESPEDIVIDLDPGQAFGTGAHASTQLVLEALQGLCDGGHSVVRFCDVGCGSGILSIAACKLWPEASGVAVDIDSLAVSATRENSQNNAVEARIASSSRAAGELGEQFDLVLANIQAHVLLALVSDIAGLVAPGGTLLLSGLLSSQAESVANTYASDHGMTVQELSSSTIDPEWTSARLYKPSPE